MSNEIHIGYDLGITKIVLGFFLISAWVIAVVYFHILDHQLGWVSFIGLGIGVFNIGYGLYRFVTGGSRMEV